jgi:hypothetical protein
MDNEIEIPPAIGIAQAINFQPYLVETPHLFFMHFWAKDLRRSWREGRGR